MYIIIIILYTCIHHVYSFYYLFYTFLLLLLLQFFQSPIDLLKETDDDEHRECLDLLQRKASSCNDYYSISVYV